MSDRKQLALTDTPFAFGCAFVWTAFLLALVAATWLSLSDELPKAVTAIVSGRQVIAHFSMHFALSVIGVALFGRRQWTVAATLALFAIVLEISQAATFTRQVSTDDLIANLAGAMLGSTLAIAFRSHARKLTSDDPRAGPQK